MYRLISLLDREPPLLAPPLLTDPRDVAPLNAVVALFDSSAPPLHPDQIEGLALAFVSGEAPTWVVGYVRHRCRQARHLAQLGATPGWHVRASLKPALDEFKCWLDTRSRAFRFPNPPRTCVPAALAMECVEAQVQDDLTDFLDYWSLRCKLAAQSGLSAESYDLSETEWLALRCHQHQEIRQMGSYLPGAYLPPGSALFSIH